MEHFSKPKSYGEFVQGLTKEILAFNASNYFEMLAPEPPKPKPLHLPYVHFDTEEFNRSCERSHYFRVCVRKEGLVTVHPTICKARRCPQCGYFWAWKWRRALTDKTEVLKIMGLPPITREIGLTTSYNCGYLKLWYALKYFWRYLRRYSPEYLHPWKAGRKKLKKGKTVATFPYAMMQYWATVEFDQEKKQPHLHCIIYNYGNQVAGYIPQKIVKEAWKRAQEKAHFEKVAWNARIAWIRGDVSRYFTKYLTKLTGDKDEIPPESWGGKFVRYSRQSKCKKTGEIVRPGFFSVGVGAITTAFGLGKWFKNPDDERSYSLITQKTTLPEFIRIVKEESEELDRLVNEPWNYLTDENRAEPWHEDFIYPPEKPPPIALGRVVGAGDIPKEYSDLPLVTHLSCPIIWYDRPVVTPQTEEEYRLAKRGFASVQ